MGTIAPCVASLFAIDVPDAECDDSLSTAAFAHCRDQRRNRFGRPRGRLPTSRPRQDSGNPSATESVTPVRDLVTVVAGSGELTVRTNDQVRVPCEHAPSEEVRPVFSVLCEASTGVGRRPPTPRDSFAHRAKCAWANLSGGILVDLHRACAGTGEACGAFGKRRRHSKGIYEEGSCEAAVHNLARCSHCWLRQQYE
jgi:hypothetical protein